MPSLRLILPDFSAFLVHCGFRNRHAAFWLYLESLKYLSPVIVGLVVCLEPLSALYSVLPLWA